MRVLSGIASMGVLMMATAAAAQTAPASAPAGPASQADIQKMVEFKQYKPALQAIAKIWPKVNAGTPDYDKYTILMLRAECLMQQKDPESAFLSYKLAMDVETTLANHETARAMVLVMKNKSGGTMFVPKTGDKTPLDLTDVEARRKAVASLYATQLALDKPLIAAAEKATTLVPVLDLVPRLRDLHALETQSTGSDTETMALVKPVADHAAELITAELERVNKKIVAIQNAASRVVPNGNGYIAKDSNGHSVWVQASGLDGLDPSARQTLRDAIPYTSQIAETCEHFYAIARQLDKGGERWQALAKSARSLKDTATAVYEHE